MIEQRLIDAIASLITHGTVKQRACLIGGQAIHDLQADLQVRLGSGIPPARASADIDLLIAFRADKRIDQDIADAIAAAWDVVPAERGPSATYAFRADPAIRLDLMATYGQAEDPAQTFTITTGGKPRQVNACRTIPRWLMDLNLLEPCRTPALHNIGLERLRHTALLATKVLAVRASLAALARPAPPPWTERIDRDLRDVLYLVRGPMRRNLWCAGCAARAEDLRRWMRPVFAEIRERQAQPQGLHAAAMKDLTELVDGYPQWWGHGDA